MKIPRRSALCLLIALSLALFTAPVHSVSVANLPWSYVQISPVSSYNRAIGGSFAINVMLNLPAGVSINAFDVRINYTNAYTVSNHGVLRAANINYQGNLFSTSGSVSLECIDGRIVQGTSCGDDSPAPGQVHLQEALLGQEVAGPRAGLLFSVSFDVTGLGVSIFAIDRASIVNPHSDPSNPQTINPAFIPVVRQDGIFGNTGVVPFFNYQLVETSLPPSIIPNHQVRFDASASFVSSNTSLTFKQYSWNFSDGTQADAPTPVMTHFFRQPGNYTVSLKATDEKNNTGIIARSVDVLPALGNLDLIVEDQMGTVLRGSVVVKMFNSSSSPTPFARQTIDAAGDALFKGLTPSDTYYVTFSGQVIENTSKAESIRAGWTTQDTVYLPLTPARPDYSGLIYAGSILGGLGVVGGAIVYKKMNSRESSRRSKYGLKNRAARHFQRR